MPFPKPLALSIAFMAAPLSAQLALPQVPVPPVRDVLRGTREGVDGLAGDARAAAQRLLDLRAERIERLVRRNRDTVELDAAGDPARRGELLVDGLTDDQRETAEAAGFAVIEEDSIDGLDLAVVRLAVPSGTPLGKAEERLRALLPDASISADTLHFQSGWGGSGTKRAAAAGPVREIPVAVGMIDGAPAGGALAIKGFAAGAPRASNHGSAVAALLRGQGAVRLRAADVYGSDPAGGNALAVARALGWLVASGSKVVTISLVGPSNAMLGKAIAAAQKKGVVVVAAVGNDGPAAPPAYPASYPGVVAVTGVDGRNRALIEAGRALNLDYAAPGADIFAPDAKGKRVRVRGTSFATPLVAARIAAALERGNGWRGTLDAEARDLGAKGVDKTYGRGLVCGACAAR